MASASTLRKINGVLPVGTGQASNETPKATKAKVPPQGKKIIIRRLAPGMTEDEFWAILGDEWKKGNGKVDWVRFHEGEISLDPSDPSIPTRCYLHLIRNEDVPILAEAVQKATWEDAKHTFNDQALVGPPYLDTASYQKVPTSKRRTDPRQGTIDQDPDYMAFLHSLTQDTPTKEVDSDQVAEDMDKANMKVTTTPLIEYLKEKKANKTKEATSTKSTKHARHESQGGKTKGGQEDSKKKAKEAKSEKAEKSAEKEKEKAKEPVKLLTKKAAAQEAAEAAKAAIGQAVTGKTTTEETAPTKSRRAGIAAAAKILQRDLGLSPGSAHRRARQDAAKAEAAAKTEAGKDKENKDVIPSAPAGPSQSATSVPASAPTAPKAQSAEGSRRSRGGKAAKQSGSGDATKSKGSESANNTAKSTPATTPVILKRKDDNTSARPGSTTPTAAASTPAPPTGPKAATGKAAASGKAGPPSQKKASGLSLVTAGATRAFVKHANPSQGVSEPLLKQAMEAFGSVTFVEIDKRKGFAYVDFGDHDGLVKAIAASPVSVAQGTVQVLERKETKKPSAPPTQPASEKANSDGQPDRPKRGGRGRGRRGGGANANNANTTAEASSSTVPPSAPASTGEPTGPD
ncbi:Smg-4/UPF3 family-domain-containing protein [Xylariaceae sp. FL0662B]|nr:Smg-4/UPF3 family-domain-containing protein [Xylariaceae sp. FL0662B]